MAEDKNTKYKNNGRFKVVPPINKASTLPDWVKKSLIVILEGVILAIIVAIPVFVHGVWKLSEQVDAIQTSIEDIQKTTTERLDTVNEDISEIEISLNAVQTTNNIITDRLSVLENAIYAMAYIRPVEGRQVSFEQNEASSEYHLAAPTWGNGDVIGIDKLTGDKCYVEELVGKKLLFPYKQAGKDVIFCGQYNSGLEWDGNCIINVYENKKLELIMEAYYSDGNILEYKQVLAYENNSGEDAWIVADRVNTGKHNSGTSWSYYREDYEMNFELENVGIYDVLDVDSFREKHCTVLEGYYSGNTSAGSYNDTTGNAYLIKFAKDGTIRTLYCGNITDGMFEDATGNAWYITRNPETNSGYMYYSGHFSNNEPVNNQGSEFYHNISMDDIQRILGDRKFDIDLVWYEKKAV